MFKRKKLNEIVAEYLVLNKEEQHNKDLFNNINKEDIEQRSKFFLKYLESYEKTCFKLIEFVKRFSPFLANSHKKKVSSYIQRQKEHINHFFEKEEIKSLTKESKNNLYNELLKQNLEFGDIHKMNITQSFILINDVLKKTKRNIPKEYDDRIGILLTKENPIYAKYYKSAWIALESDAHDKLRHFSSSMRELIINFLGKNKEEYKQNLQKFLTSKTERKLIESIASTLNNIHKIINKGVHDELDFETAVLSMSLTENVLYYLLTPTRTYYLKTDD